MGSSTETEAELEQPELDHSNYGKPFSSRGYIESNLQDLKEVFVENGTDQVIILVVGGANTGKTSLSLLCQQYLDGEVSTGNIALNHQEWVDIHTTNDANPDEPPKKTIVYEEGRDSFFRTNAITKKNKKAKDILYEYRSYQNFLFINFQNVEDLAPFLPMQIADGMFRAVKKGWVHFYGKKTMRKMWSRNTSRRFMGWAKPDFKDGYPDPANEIPEQWERYKKSNLRKLQNNGIDGDKELDTDIEVGEQKDRKINKHQMQTLRLMEANGKITQKDIVDAGIYRSRPSANQGIKNMVEKGMAKKLDAGPNYSYTNYVYELTDKGEIVLDIFD